MTWQFVGGLANLIGEVAMARLIIRWTEGLAYEFAVSITLIVTIPVVVGMLTLPMWARYLDRVHIARFRVRHGLVWIILQALNWIGAMLGSVGLLCLPRAASGLMRGGGMLAWNLGHNDFADRRLVATYMGIHVTLTGVRGLVAAYVAIYLMEGWAGVPQLGDFGGLGAHVFAVTLVLAVVAEFGFLRLSRRLARDAAR